MPPDLDIDNSKRNVLTSDVAQLGHQYFASRRSINTTSSNNTNSVMNNENSDIFDVTSTADHSILSGIVKGSRYRYPPLSRVSGTSIAGRKLSIIIHSNSLSNQST